MNALKLVPSNVKSKPLLETTILIIEDSKYVCEAMRLSVYTVAQGYVTRIQWLPPAVI